MLQRLSRTWLFSVALVAAAPGCARQESGELKDLAADRNANNVALFFGAPVNLTGVPIDIRKNKALFEDRTMNFGFEVNAINQATKQMILDKTREKAAQVGPGGTLLWYFSGHGLENGAMYTQDEQTLFFKDVAAVIKSARSTPLKRLVVVIDNCFSGTNLEGEDAIIPEGNSLRLAGPRASAAAANTVLIDSIEGALKGPAGKNAYSTSKLYEQALVFTASQSDETSLDGENGGIFSEAWRKTLKRFHDSSTSDRLTLRDLVEQTTKQTQTDSNGHHLPEYRAIPSDAVLSEPLWTKAGPNTGGGTVDTGGGTVNTGAEGTTQSGTGQPVAAKSAYAMLSNDSGMYIAAPQGTASVTLCRGNILSCWLQPTTELGFAQYSGQSAPRDVTMFRGNLGFTPVENQEFTMILFNSAGWPVGARTMKFQSR